MGHNYVSLARSPGRRQQTEPSHLGQKRHNGKKIFKLRARPNTPPLTPPYAYYVIAERISSCV